MLKAGGNCELTSPGEKIVHKGVTIIGYTVRCTARGLVDVLTAGLAISSSHSI